MESVTFKTRQQFLNEFYSKDRVEFLSTIKNINIIKDHPDNRINNRIFILKTKTNFNLSICNQFKIFCKFLKSFTYFLYSTTYYENFIQDKFLFFSNLELKFSTQILNLDEIVNKTVYFDITYPDPIPYIDNEDYNFLKSIKTEDILNDSIKNILYLKMKLTTKYITIDQTDYLYLGGIDEEEQEPEEEPIREIRENHTIINSSQCFKSAECVICLTNPPNVLFCNCGHICYCSECENLKNSNRCPICKTENEIIRVLE